MQRMFNWATGTSDVSHKGETKVSEDDAVNLITEKEHQQAIDHLNKEIKKITAVSANNFETLQGVVKEYAIERNASNQLLTKKDIDFADAQKIIAQYAIERNKSQKDIKDAQAVISEYAVERNHSNKLLASKVKDFSDAEGLIADLSIQLQATSKQVEALNAEVDSISRQAEDLEGAYVLKLSQYVARSCQWEEQRMINSLISEENEKLKMRLKNKIDSFTQTINDLQTQLSELAQKNKQYEGEVFKVTQEKSLLQKQLEEANKEISVLKNAIDVQAGEYDNLSLEVTKLEGELKVSHDEQEVVTALSDHLEQLTKDLKTENMRLNEALAQSQHEAEKQKRGNDELRQQNAELAQKNKALVEKMHASVKEKDELHQSIDRLKKSNASLDRSIASVKQSQQAVHKAPAVAEHKTPTKRATKKTPTKKESRGMCGMGTGIGFLSKFSVVAAGKNTQSKPTAPATQDQPSSTHRSGRTS